MNVIHYIAVKLSVVTTEVLKEILNIYHGTVIIDAEHQRLDHWYQRNRDLESSRLVITVQTSRRDTEEQVRILNGLGVRVLLVKGNSAYVSHRSDWLEVMGKLWDKYANVLMLGISKVTLQKLQGTVLRQIRHEDVLELLGYQELIGSRLYTYVSIGHVLSEAATKYLERRGGEGHFIIREEAELDRLRNLHNLVLYVDFLDFRQYVGDIMLLTAGGDSQLCEK